MIRGSEKSHVLKVPEFIQTLGANGSERVVARRNPPCPCGPFPLKESLSSWTNVRSALQKFAKGRKIVIGDGMCGPVPRGLVILCHVSTKVPLQ